MYIKGIGVIKKEKAMSILTSEGKHAVKSGDITTNELGEIYKLEMVKRLSRIGRNGSTFSSCYKWIPDELKGELSPENLAKLTDCFYNCYSAGKNQK